jgi:hypothetical protein
MEHSEYCREIETYLCRKNEGHLIRIVGPAFEQVCSWAERGVPLKIAFRGIDRYCERYYAKGPRRRPVRIEFCEADILDLFDQWRRAVGVTAADAGVAEGSPSSRKPSLGSHIERAVARLTSLRAGARHSGAFDARVDAAVRELDGAAADARHARGESRARIIVRLAEIDRDLIALAVQELDPDLARSLRRDADLELAPFGPRMAPEARARAATVAFERLVREALKLPVLAYE